MSQGGYPDPITVQHVLTPPADPGPPQHRRHAEIIPWAEISPRILEAAPPLLARRDFNSSGIDRIILARSCALTGKPFASSPRRCVLKRCGIEVRPEQLGGVGPRTVRRLKLATPVTWPSSPPNLSRAG